MNSKKKEIIILISLAFLLVILNYNFLDSKVENFLLRGQEEKVFVERVIDGDTIVTEIGNVRLLGINTPERGELGFWEAKKFLENLILNKSVVLEYIGERQDKYERVLAYIYFNGENINIKIVEEGFGNYYFYSGRDVYSDDLEVAWNSCINKNVNLCKKSKDICSECISISSNKIVNECGFTCNLEGWEIKGEGREKVVFNSVLENGGEIEFELSLDNSRGSLFLYDRERKLVSWKIY